jgi:hypothetical protein
MSYREFMDFVAVVDKDDWLLAVEKHDEAAKERIATALDGVDLYFHGGPNMEGIGVTIADLICHGIIKRVTLHKDE